MEDKDLLLIKMSRFIKGVFTLEVWERLKGDTDLEKATYLVNSEENLKKLSFEELLGMNSKTVLVKCFSEPAPIKQDTITPMLITVNRSRSVKVVDFCEADGNRLFSINEAYAKHDLNNNKHINVYELSK